jgi:Kef-type K+ transport system membrane component KefB
VNQTLLSQPVIGLIALWCASRALGSLARTFRQPAIIGELLAGVLFSASFLGHRFPVASPLLTTTSFYAGAAFLFFAGFEIPLSSVLGRFRIGAPVSAAGAVVPFLIGLACATAFPERFGFDGHSTPAVFGLFLGVSLAVSALPVIARTLMDVGIYHSPIGSVTMSAVILDDIFVWILFSTLIATTIHSEPGAWIHFYMPVAAYILGIVVGEAARKRKIPTRKAADWLANRALSPLYFAAIGLKIGSLANFDLELTLLLIAIATLGKVVACALAARFGGMKNRDAWSIGFAMNSRGAMSVLLSSLSHDLGIIGDRLFLSLVIMAIATSVMSGPALRWLLKPPGEGRVHT